jgi:hypothetical protein
LGLIAQDGEGLNSQPSDKLASGHTLTEPTLSKSQSPKTTNGVPTPLSPMLAMGLSRGGLFKLMGIATKHGKRLEDICTVLGIQFKNMRGGELFGFLRNRAIDEKDYSYLAKLQREEEQKAAQARIDAIKSKQARAELKGKTFVNPKRSIIFSIDGTGKYLHVDGLKGSGSNYFSEPLKLQEEITRGDLVPATKKLLEQIKSKILIAKRDAFFGNSYDIKRKPVVEQIANQVNPIIAEKRNQEEAAIKKLPQNRDGFLAILRSMSRGSSNFSAGQQDAALAT